MIVRKFVLLFVTVAFSLLPAHAQFVAQAEVGTSGSFSCRRNSSIAVSADGNTAILGIDCSAASEGALIYVRSNAVWSQQGPALAGSGAIGTALQAKSVAISADGNTAVIGGPNDNSLAGAAWVFTRANGVWTQLGPKLVGSDATANALQGTSVGISADGNTVLVGGPKDANSGATWVYTRGNGVWNQQGPKLAGSGAVGNSSQGTSLALSADGNTAIVGGPDDNGHVGAAWVYVRTNQVWSQQGGKLVGSGVDLSPGYQGLSVSLSADGNTALIGGPQSNFLQGGAWVFVRNYPFWSQQGGRLTGNAAEGTRFFGVSVSLSANGDTALIGASGFDLIGPAVWSYVRANGIWTQGAKLPRASDGNNTFLPISAALSGDGNTAIAGGIFDNDSRGVVWAYARPRMSFVLSAPQTAIAGVPFNFTVTAKDASFTTDTGYSGTVHFTSNDPLAVLPADATLINGAGTFQATFRNGSTVSSKTITATDTANPSTTGTSGMITIQAARATHFIVTASSLADAAGLFSFSFVPVDQFGNVDFAYTGRVRFTSSDARATLPPEEPGNSPAFLAVFRTLGDQTITVTDTQNPTITGTSGAITVRAAFSPNLALGKPATQSSTLPGYATGGPAAAVDGVTDGNFFNGSVTHTNLENSPWWQVDIGASQLVRSIEIWNRTDCCGTRLNDYWIFLSDTPFGPADTPATLQNRPGTWSRHQTVTPNPSTIIAPGNMRARYLRVQLSGAGYLSLAEVRVLSEGSDIWNLAGGKAASQSSTLAGTSAGASLAVNGDIEGNFYRGSVTHTDLDTEPWWEVDLGFSLMVDTIMISNRTDCCGSRLGDYYIFVSNTPFSPTDTIETLMGRAIWFHQTSAPNPSVALSLSAIGRYIRIQLPGRNYLSLAEVQVSGSLLP